MKPDTNTVIDFVKARCGMKPDGINPRFDGDYALLHAAMLHGYEMAVSDAELAPKPQPRRTRKRVLP